MSALGICDAPGPYHLTTMRFVDPFNPTIDGFSLRLRGLKGFREIMLINQGDMAREGDVVSFPGDSGHDIRHESYLGGARSTERFR